jgi:hypothetical protein
MFGSFVLIAPVQSPKPVQAQPVAPVRDLFGGDGKSLQHILFTQ